MKRVKQTHIQVRDIARKLGLKTPWVRRHLELPPFNCELPMGAFTPVPLELASRFEKKVVARQVFRRESNQAKEEPVRDCSWLYEDAK